MPFTVAALRTAVASSALLTIALAPTFARAEALLLMEADTGKVLQAENAAYPWYPASVTKLMTAYVTLKAVKDGRMTLNTMLSVSPNAVAQAPTKMGFATGTQVTVDNALKMLMVKSANDMAVVLAEGVGGSIDGFSDEMNRTAARLGMTQTSYVNPNGLPADGQITSARDLGILARAIYRDLPEYEYFWHLPGIKFGRRVIRNYNSLLDKYPGADGMKTGFICASGFNLVASATRNGKHLIAVVLGAPSSSMRAYKAAQMLERGFNQNGLSWLQPTLGTVENIMPIDAAPPNLRDEMCGPHRKRPNAPASDDDNADAAGGSEGAGGQLAFFLSAKSAAKGPILAEGSNNLGPPVEVFIGAPRAQQPMLAATGATTVPAPKPAVLSVSKPSQKTNAALSLRPTGAAIAVPTPSGKPDAGTAKLTQPKPSTVRRAAAKPPAAASSATPAAAKPAAAKPAAAKSTDAAKPAAAKSTDAAKPAAAKPVQQATAPKPPASTARAKSAEPKAAAPAEQ